MTDETEQPDNDFAAFEATANAGEPVEAADETKADDKGPDDEEPGEVNDKDETLELTEGDELADDDEEKGEKRRSKPLKQRLGEVSEKRRLAETRAETAERERDHWKGVAEGTIKPEAAETELKAPNPDDFEFGEADPGYIDALTDYKVETKLAERDQKRTAEEAEANRTASARELDGKWAEQASKAAERHPDFAEVMADYQENEPCPPILAVAIASSEQGADIAYHLAKNPDENRELARLATTDPLEAARRFGRMEARFEMQGDKSQDKVVKLTEAPEPPKHNVRGGGGKFEVGADTADFAAFERKVNGKR